MPIVKVQIEKGDLGLKEVKKNIPGFIRDGRYIAIVSISDKDGELLEEASVICKTEQGLDDSIMETISTMIAKGTISPDTLASADVAVAIMRGKISQVIKGNFEKKDSLISLELTSEKVA